LCANWHIYKFLDSTMANESFSRKDFLKKISLFGMVAAGSSAVLTACGGGSSTPEPAPVAAADPCEDLTGLADSDKQMRTTLGYVKETPDPDKRCDNCQLYVVPAEGSSCGGCTLFKGPVHPAGYCNSWVAKMS
jgi:hypothetical protein